MAATAAFSTSMAGGGMNGITNGYTNGHTDGHSNGYLNGSVNGHADALVNGHTNGDSAPSTSNPKQMPIAIVGMACRLPGNVATPDEFWELCSRARHGYSAIPKHRFNDASFQHPNPGKSGTFNPVGGCFLECDLERFDAPFFSLTAQEATSLDPQQRLLLECTFEALDSAGIPKHTIVGKDVGVFIGGSFSEYESHLFRDPDTIPMYQATGCAFALQSNRISHFFDLRGPSFTMDTACSSSLVALHLACQSLRNGESTAAIVGGCHLNILPEFWISMSMSRLFSDEGRCFSFDNRGTGYGRGEGCGMVVLKPLDQALKDNDSIRAVIVGTGINQDGKTPGITMPNGDAQEALIRSVYASAGINPADAGFVEAHGTGTRVGDPIEATAINAVLGVGRTPSKPLFIGSLKSNIGHLEAASGIVSVIKSAMMLERGFILPNYDFKKPNEKIPFAKWNLKVPISQRPWPRPKRFASVNNFGFGGTNAHAVLEKAPFVKKAIAGAPTDASTSTQSRKLFVLTANDKISVESMMKKMGIYLEQRPEIFQSDLMNNVAYTLGQRRSLMQWRVAIPAQTSFELVSILSGEKVIPVKDTEAPRIGYIFTGQGAQWYAMGRELYEQYPVFASSINLADKCLTALGAPFSLVEELNRDEKTSAVGAAHISQPSCTAIQLALVDLLQSWGVQPSAVAGHSSGEIGAAYAAGILTHEACMAIAYHRGRVTINLKKKFPELRGAMMAVGGGPEDVAPLIATLREKEVKIACINSPSSVTVSGDAPAISELQKLIEEKQMFNRKLQVDMAYHSHHMELVADDYLQSIEALTPPISTDVKFHSSLLGELTDGSKLQPSYWVENLTCPVRFSEALTSMAQPIDGFKTGVNLIVEVGPHAALAGPVKQILKSVGANAMKIPYASTLVRKRDAVETALELAATLFTKGAMLDFGAINFPKPGKVPTLLIDMPRYPWNHQTKYWHESRMTQLHKSRPSARSDLLGTIANYSNELEPTWRNIVRIDDLPWLRHHKIQGVTLFPMSAFIAMALEAAAQKASRKDIHYDSFELRDVTVHNALMVTDDDFEMTLTLRPFQEGTLYSSEVWDEFRIHSWAASKGWTEHCKGLVSLKSEDFNEVDGAQQRKISEALLSTRISTIRDSQKTALNTAEMYSALSEIGVDYGPTFQGLSDCQASDKSSIGRITVTDTAQEMPHGFQTSTIIHPAFLEQLIEMYWPILGAGRSTTNTVYLPSSIGKLVISRTVTSLASQPGNTLQGYCEGSFSKLHAKPTKVSMFAVASEDSGKALVTLDDLTITPIVEREMQTDTGAHRELCYKLEWEPVLEPLHAETQHGATTMNGINHFPNMEIAIIHEASEHQQFLASTLSAAIENLTDRKPEVGTLLDINTNGKLCIFLSELDKALLANLSATHFLALQKVLTSVQGVLWVVRGAYVDSQAPESNMVTGLSRTIRSETLLKFATLDLDAKSKLSDDETVKAIIKVFEATFGAKPSENGELEYMERAGSFLTPRIINDSVMNEYVHKQTNKSVIEPAPFAQGGRSLIMSLGTTGAFDTLHFGDNVAIEATLPEDEIEIDVKAIGMNFRDVQAATGHNSTDKFGSECSGIVTSVGTGVTTFQAGDHVACLTEGAFATHARAKAAFAFKVPNTLPFETSATIPLAHCSALYSLIDLGRLASDESVLIHSAASALGQASIALAKRIGAKIFTTVNNVEEKTLLMTRFGLSEDCIFYTENPSFAATIKQATSNTGVDVVLNTVSGDALQKTWDCLNSFGRFIELGKTDSTTNTRLEFAQFESNASFISVDMAAVAMQRPKLMAKLLAEVAVLVKTGNVEPVSRTEFPISDVETAFKLMQTGKFHGKLVVVPHAEDKVMATPSKLQNKILRPDVTYVLIGGTGGLGRSMTRWMVSKGARNIALISRSGSATGKVKDLIDELGEVGANIVVRRCNVVDKTEVEDLINKGLVGLPPVKGVVHGAMVLRDVLFEKMTFEEYTTVIESKVQGAWNFHHALSSTPLDFFVVISSAAGAVGNRGQAAYSAANTFLNAFAQYRLALGQHAASIDLTAVSDVGYLADNAEAAAEVAKNLGSDTICEAEVLALIGAAIDGRLATACNSHTITGMRITPAQQPFWTTDAKFLHLRLAAEAEAAATSGSKATIVSFNAAVKAAKSLPEAEKVVCDGLVDKISNVLMLELEDMDITRPLSQYALDSLVAIEVRNFITREFEANMQVLELLSSGCIENLAKAICVKSKIVSF